MKGYQEPAFMDATDLAKLIRKKEILPCELMDDTIDRIEKINPRLNAVVTPMFEEARKAAREPLPEGPFAGVPFLIKDLLASYAGVRMTLGTKNMGSYIADHDSELVRRYKKAGFITVGKTNTPEFGLMPTTESRFLGPCRNPWDLSRTTGGSSGGSAAAVAAGLVPVAHGNDGGGSIRIPASCCGLFGLKPTRGRNPLGPDHGDIMSGLVSEHVLTRSVRDSAAILDATMGYAAGDPYCAPGPKRPFIKEVGKDPGRLRIAYLTQMPRGGALPPDCANALADAVKLCGDLGHELIVVTPDYDARALGIAFGVIWASNNVTEINAVSSLTGKTPSPADYEPITWALYEMGLGCTAADYLAAVRTIQTISRQVARFFADCDMFLTPTLGEAPVPLGTFDSPPEDPLKGWRRSGRFSPFTPICNATGHPAMSVPLYWSDQGLPIGVHFMGPFGGEAVLFRLAAQLEKARPWKNKRPPVCA
ncbi:MAG: amidase [Deltaproteobacteria bacterium]|nr:amidase [Deltaproteobacteria bacterium]